MPKLPSSSPASPPKPGARPLTTVDKVAILCWKVGDDFLTRKNAKQLLAALGLTGQDVTHGVLHAAIGKATERLRAGFRKTNNNPRSRIKVVIHGDREFDPSVVYAKAAS